MGRSPRAPALAAAFVLVALVGPAAAASSVFTALGNSFVVSTPEWTLMSPFSQTGGGTGVFYNATSIFTFTAPKNRGPRSNDGTTVKRTTTMRFNKITLTPVTVTASSGLQPIPGAVGPVLRRLRVRLPKGSLVPQTTGVTFVPQGTAFPYSVLYGGPSQASATLLTPNTGAKILGKPQLKYGKDKPIQISTSSPTFQLATAGTASALCANGYGGAIGTAKSGCGQCAAGSFASGFDQSTPCKLCSSVSSNSISAQAGASSCTNCTAGTTPNANGTACVGGGSVTPVTNTLSMTAPGPCSTATAAQIKASQEAFLLSQPGVQSVNVTVTCAPANRRRALLQTNGTVVYTSTVTCIGTTSTTQCTAGFTALTAQVSPCCPRSASCTAPLLTPANCTGTTTGGCAVNFYVANGTCVSCGSGATSAGGSVTSCTCTNGATWSSSTGCPTGPTCTPGTYFVAGACAPCPVNSYCLGGVGAQAVATPCPGTSSTNGATAQTSLSGCVQGNSYKTLASNPAQSWTSIASYGGSKLLTGGTAPTEGLVRIAAGTNGLLYGTPDSGLTWAATGPDAISRTWTAVSTCQAPEAAGIDGSTVPYAVVAVADNGGVYVAVSSAFSATPSLPAANKWTKISVSSGTNGPLDSLPFTSVACAVPVATATAGGVPGVSGARIYVIASSGGGAGQVWLGTAIIPASPGTPGAPGTTPTANAIVWTDLTATVGGAGDFSSVAAGVAGTGNSADQAVAFAVAKKGSSGALYTGTSGVLAGATLPTITWAARTGVALSGTTLTNFVSVDVASDPASAAATALPVVAAIGNSRVITTTALTSSTTYNFIAAADQPWVSVDYNFAGSALAAAASIGGIWYTGTPTTGNSLTNITVATAITQANTVSFPQAWTDIALVGTGAITATLPGSVGYGIQQGALAGTVWSNAAASNSRPWVDVATSASGARVIAITATDVYISNTNGSTWGASAFTGANLVSVSTDSTGNIIAVGSSSTDRVYASTDGGVTWFQGGAALVNGAATATQLQRVSVNSAGTRIYATTKATGGVSGADGFIYVGTGNFQAFAPANSASTVRDWEYIEAGSGLNVVMSTTAGTAYKSIDGAVNTVAVSTGLTSSRTWKVQASADGTVLAALDAAGVEAFTTTCTSGSTTCASWTKVSPSGFPATGLQAISLSADGSRLFVTSNAASQGIWTGTATATPGTFNWIGPKGVATTAYANIASSSNGGFVYAAATSGLTTGGTAGSATDGQIWQGFGTV